MDRKISCKCERKRGVCEVLLKEEMLQACWFGWSGVREPEESLALDASDLVRVG